MNKERDLNYVAKLEKAIKKKYGEEAVQNPASFWDEEKEKIYLQQLAEFVEKQRKYESSSEPENVNGILITRKLLNKERKLNCPVCSKKLRTVNDDIHVTKFECCEGCYIKNIERHIPNKAERSAKKKNGE